MTSHDHLHRAPVRTAEARPVPGENPRHVSRWTTRRSRPDRRRGAAAFDQRMPEPIASSSVEEPPTRALPTTMNSIHQAVAAVLPWAGHLCRVALKDSIMRTIAAGAIDRDKYLALKGGADYLPADCLAALNRASDDTIHLTTTNAAEYVDLLWPVGLANHLAANESGSIAGPDVDTYASTGGWNLGRAETGGQYFNKHAIIDLTDDQQELAVRVAKSTFRPCCDNSTFFQDCNHGSALFAVLQLGASQGLDEEALYREALAFNSFWFPDTYIATALLFKAIRHVDWADVDPKVITGQDYSTASGWDKNVWQPLQAHPDLLPPPTNNVNCGA